MRTANLTTFSNHRYLNASLLLAFTVFLTFGLTMREGHNWDGDFALYIMQAQNIVNGTPYAHTHYIFNAKNPTNPALYPPGLPLIIAPVYLLSGLNIAHIKWLLIVMWAGFVFIFGQVARRLLPDSLALVCTALIGLHPYFWELKDAIYAEFPFLVFSYGALYFADRLISHPTPQPSREQLLDATALAIFIALAYLTRTVAVVLFPAVLMTAVVQGRRHLFSTIASLTAAGAIIGAVLSWFPSDPGTYIGYFDQFHWRGIYWALRDYALGTATLLQVGSLKMVAWRHACAIAYVSLVSVGFVTSARRRISVFELFMAAYVALLLIYPVRWEVERYSIPFWPLSLVYAFNGALALGTWLHGSNLQRLLPAALATVLLVNFTIAYSHKDLNPLRHSVTGPEARQLYDAIVRVVPSGGLVLSRKPTVIGLFTKRDSATWPRNFGDDREFWNYAHGIGAHYLIQDLGQEGDGPYNPNDRLDAFVNTNGQLLVPVFQNASFRLFRFN